ncbi:DUF5329 domain-containing protein [Luteimonas aquatica]|uniref:DUF5329 domain-containing protein n=1 Tax=Luteimonas aquatica TaxID=450364 RepID=UPI001F583CFE|nr:DUF5329 domain-containing protein [Luteimonas aquatica]
MRAMHRIGVVALGIGCAALLCAATAPAAESEREIDGLIRAIGDSGCEFERNGSWHDAAAARAHLQRKYDWLRKRDAAGNAEQFIERAATRSSVSGKPYRVRCRGRAPQPASAWFGEQLRRQRQDAKTAGPTR